MAMRAVENEFAMEENLAMQIPSDHSKLQLYLPEGVELPGSHKDVEESYIIMEEEQLKKMLAWQQCEEEEQKDASDPQEKEMAIYAEGAPEEDAEGWNANEMEDEGDEESDGVMPSQQMQKQSKKPLTVLVQPNNFPQGGVSRAQDVTHHGETNDPMSSRTEQNNSQNGQPDNIGGFTQLPRSRQPHRVVKPTSLGMTKSSPLPLHTRKHIVRVMKAQGYPYIKKKVKRKRKKVRGLDKDKENLVVSIHRRGKLVRVVMMKEAPYLCTQCGLTFIQSAVLKEHAETEHCYVEPAEGADNEIMPLAVVQRSFPEKRMNRVPQDTPPSDKQNLPSTEQAKAQTSLCFESDKSNDTNFSDSDDNDVAWCDNNDSPMNETENYEAPMEDDDSDDTNDLHEGLERKRKQQRKSVEKIQKFEAVHVGDANSAGSRESKDKPKKKKKKSYLKRGKKCHFCPVYFRLSNELKTHLAEKHGEYSTREEALQYRRKEIGACTENNEEEVREVLMCSYCEVYFNEESSASRHVRKHCGVDGIKCDICTEAIQLWQEGRSDELGRLKTKYIDDGDGFDSATEERGHGGDGAKVQDVNSVGKLEGESKVAQLMRLSMERANKVCLKDFFLVTCAVCREEFYVRSHLQNHYRWHGKLPCKECGQEFPTMTAIQEHTSKEHKIGFFKCHFCPRRYWNCGKLNYHMIGHLGLFQCIVCGFTAMSSQTLRRHIIQTVDWPDHKECSDTDRKKYSYSNPFITTKANRFKGKRSRKLKVRRKVQRDVEAQRHKCPKCPATLKTRPILLHHIKLKHSGPVPYTHMCSYCGKGFRSTTHARYHERQHTGEKTHQCEQCHKCFADPSTLKVHLSTHSTHKPFICEFCGRAFPTLIYLNAHKRVHTKPYKCPQCGLGFAQLAARRNHLKKAHGIEEQGKANGVAPSAKNGDSMLITTTEVPATTGVEMTGMNSVGTSPVQCSIADFFEGNGLTSV